MLLESSSGAGLRGGAAVLFACVAVALAGAGAVNPRNIDAKSPPRAEDASARAAELRAEIARHDDLYYRQAAPEISDFEYDQLKRELEALERALPDQEGSHPEDARAVGDDRTGRFPTRRHAAPMLSLDKAYSKSEFMEFHKRCAAAAGGGDVRYAIEPKIDGIAISLVYERGRFVRAVTRGDGSEGDEITANARAIQSLPETLRAPDGMPPPALVELRGELFLTFEAFERINRERAAAGEPEFANPRNLAAGTAKLDDPAEVAARGLSLAVFGYGAWEPERTAPPSQTAFLEQARAWGLPTPEASAASGADAALEAMRSLERRREKLGFPIDGAVAKVDDAALQRALGLGASAPRWAVAWKFGPTRVATRLLSIEFEVGRSGALTPVAILEPVAFGGSEIGRSSLYNLGYIERLDLRVGDFVFLEKAGGVIPRIVGADPGRRGQGGAFEAPSACPSCGEPAVVEAAALRCANDACPGRALRRMEYFASGYAVDIEGLGEAWLARLMEAGLAADIPDLYRLRRDELLALGGDIELSVDKLLASIERSKRAPLWQFVNGLGIPGIGPSRAKRLADELGSFEELARQGGAAEAAARAGIGPAAERSVAAHFDKEANRRLVLELLALGVEPGRERAR